jgi:hypothetical protein
VTGGKTDEVPENGTNHFQDGMTDVFFSTKFDFEPPQAEESNVNVKVTNNISSTGSPKELGSVIEEKSEPSSPEEEALRSVENNRRNEGPPQHSLLRKPIMKDTIPEVPDPDMKKSDSFNIFEAAKDPFADDDFFV